MWLIYDSIAKEDNLTARNGKKYSAYILRGKRKGMEGEEDTPYEKKLFDNTACTVIERGIDRPNCSAVQFFQKAVQPGDIVIVKFVRRAANMWDIESLQKLGDRSDAPTYEPLSDEEVKSYAQVEQASKAYTETTPPWIKK